jgi:hypothetical protein
MDLLGALSSIRKALGVFTSNSGQNNDDWTTSEEAFECHFGVPYEAFEEIVHHLSPDQDRLLQATLAVNPEAAVLWILAMEEVPT